MRKNKVSASIFAIAFGLMAPAAFAASFEIKASNGSERGWSARAECNGECTQAYFCSNNIWLEKQAFDRVQAKRYAGEQLIIVKDGAPICAVN